MNRFKILDWDSDFFGMTVAAILPQRLIASELRDILASLAKARARLVYWASDPEDEESQLAARVCNGFLADRKVTYVADLERIREPCQSSIWTVTEYVGALGDSDLEDLAVQAGQYSRFKVDPGIPEEKFADMYKLWMRKSLSGEMADGVLVARLSGKIVGMTTVAQKDNSGDIGLIVVGKDARGRGLGFQLVSAAQQWARQRRLQYARVVTQARNGAACKLYEKCGYRLSRLEHLYHFWI